MVIENPQQAPTVNNKCHDKVNYMYLAKILWQLFTVISSTST